MKMRWKEEAGCGAYGKKKCQFMKGKLFLCFENDLAYVWNQKYLDSKVWNDVLLLSDMVEREKINQQERNLKNGWEKTPTKHDALKTEATWQKASGVRVRKDWRWTTLTTEWSPTDGRRIKGRHRRRRTDGLGAFAGPTWLRLAQERDAEWHNGEAFVLLWLTWGCDEHGGEDSEDDDDYINIKKEHT